ncbi:hypothetical protein [Caproiciproducens sp.]
MEKKIIFLCLPLFAAVIFLLYSERTGTASEVNVISLNSSEKGTVAVNDLPAVQSDQDCILLYNAKTVEELEELSPNIVQGTLLDDAEQKILRNKEGDITLSGINISSLKITKVYKGDLKIGDIIKLGERYYITDENGKEKVVYDGNYLPSTVGKEYLFFLGNKQINKDYWSGTYAPKLLEKGRYPVRTRNGSNFLSVQSIESMTNKELNLGNDDSTEYKALYEQVAQKYMK